MQTTISPKSEAKYQFDMSRAMALRQSAFERLRALNGEVTFTSLDNMGINEGQIPDLNACPIAIIPIHGFMVRELDFFSWFMGGTSTGMTLAAFDQALEDPKIKAIVFDINSPGGEVDGAPELAQRIFEARGKKSILAYIGNEGCSAAYWVASACDMIIAHETALVGSIGVMATYSNYTDPNLIDVVSSVSPLKDVDVSTPEGIAQVKRHIDAVGSIFVSNVSKYRGVPVETVLQSFGQGDVVIGQEALSRGMIDQLGTFNTALTLSQGPSNKGASIMEGRLNAADPIDPDTIDLKWIQQNKPELVDEVVKNLDVDTLKEKNPELVQKLTDGGAADENNRIKEVDDVEKTTDDNTPEAQALFKAAKYEKRMTAKDLQSELYALSIKRREALASGRREDAAAIPPVVSGAVAAAGDDIKTAMIAGIKNGRRM
jgi:signal peptide peptidase SppA